MKRLETKISLIMAGCVLVAGATAGCMTGNAKRFFAENKSYTFKKANMTLATPWGTETISADEITSVVVYPYGLSNVVVTVPTPAPVPAPVIGAGTNDFRTWLFSPNGQQTLLNATAP